MKAGKDPGELWQAWHPNAMPARSGHAATEQDIHDARAVIMGRMCGVAAGSQEQNARYGLAIGKAIAEVIDPVPTDAADDGGWSFLSLVVFPDVVAARWPLSRDAGGKPALPPDRWIGRPIGRDRNYLKEAWRRWVILGDILEVAEQPLGEDELVNLLERTAFARNRRLVRAAARCIAGRQPGALGGRMVFAREMLKRLRFQTGVVMLDIVSDEMIESTVAQAAEQADSALQDTARRG